MAQKQSGSSDKSSAKEKQRGVTDRLSAFLTQARSGYRPSSSETAGDSGQFSVRSIMNRDFFYGLAGEYSKKLWVRITLSAAMVLLVILISYHLYLGYYSDIKMETVDVSTYSETIDVEGISIRDEMVITGGGGDFAVNAVDDGEKVAKGQTIINLFHSADEAAAYTRIGEIDDEIAVLQSMVNGSEDSANAVNNIEKLIDEQVVGLTQDVYKGNLNDIEGTKNQLTYLFNKRLIAMRKVEDYSDRIAALESEKASLQASLSRSPGTVEAPASGYFVNAPDGYENLLKVSMLENLTAEELSDIMSRDVSAPSSASGKLMRNFVWYIACPVPKDEAEDQLVVNSIYTLILPYSETGSTDATLEYLNEGEGDTLLAIFRCNSLGSELCDIRRQPVKIQTRSYRGFNIRKSALHVKITEVSVTDALGSTRSDEKRTTCVYVLVGNQVVARRVNILYNGDSFVICEYSKIGESGYLSRYDKVIIEGKGLYAGKIINVKS